MQPNLHKSNLISVTSNEGACLASCKVRHNHECCNMHNYCIIVNCRSILSKILSTFSHFVMREIEPQSHITRAILMRRLLRVQLLRVQFLRVQLLRMQLSHNHTIREPFLMRQLVRVQLLRVQFLRVQLLLVQLRHNHTFASHFL
jgi:hypothetical protein